MFQWSKKVIKSVTFNPGVADESLLALIESYLEKEPDKTFSELCKEALWQSLCVPESVKPAPKPTVIPGVEKHIAQLQSQMADLEERFFAKESRRLETIESQVAQLSQQVAQLAIKEPSRLEMIESQIVQLSQQVAQLAIKEPSRLETIESHMVQLSQQVAQLAIMVNQASITQSPTPSVPAIEVVRTTPIPTNAVTTPPIEDDPLISRISQYLDDF